jgi:hypothetical protein
MMIIGSMHNTKGAHMPKQAMIFRAFIFLCATHIFLSPRPAYAQDIQPPEAFVGFKMGADYQLAVGAKLSITSGMWTIAPIG